MTPHQLRRRLLQTLRHEGLNLYVIADQVEEPPFRVRAELRGMKRDRLVRHNPHTGDWELTTAGTKKLYAGDQMELA